MSFLLPKSGKWYNPNWRCSFITCANAPGHAHQYVKIDLLRDVQWGLGLRLWRRSVCWPRLGRYPCSLAPCAIMTLADCKESHSVLNFIYLKNEMKTEEGAFFSTCNVCFRCVCSFVNLKRHIACLLVNAKSHVFVQIH